MSATIKDVAKLAGCSIKTVSRVINDEPHVTEDLRDRVKSAIRQVGYAPNLSARRLVQNKSFMICILMYPGFHQQASAILSRVLDVSYDEGYDILIQPFFSSHARSRNKLVEMIGERRMDGFITTPPCDADGFVADMLTTYKVPLVQINPITRSEKIPYVAGDDYQGAYGLTEHLIQLGHRRIAFLMGPRNLRSAFDRFYGFRAALDSHQIVLHEEWVKNSEFTFDGGYTATRLLMDQPQAPTAIFAGNDEAAYGALFALQEMGKIVPRDVSVCGYDDYGTSKNIWPGLTTVHQPAEEMLENATRLLIKILKGEKQTEQNMLLSSPLVIRGSTGRVTAEP